MDAQADSFWVGIIHGLWLPFCCWQHFRMPCERFCWAQVSCHQAILQEVSCFDISIPRHLFFHGTIQTLPFHSVPMHHQPVTMWWHMEHQGRLYIDVFCCWCNQQTLDQDDSSARQQIKLGWVLPQCKERDLSDWSLSGCPPKCHLWFCSSRRCR